MSNGHRQTDGWRRRRTAAAVAVVGLGLATGSVATASTDTTVPTEGTAGGGEVDYHWTPNADLLGRRRGRGQPRLMGGVRGGRLHRPGSRLGDTVRGDHRLRRQQPARRLSDEMVSLMQSGEYDAVSASGDATERLIAGGRSVPSTSARCPATSRSSTTSSCSSGTPSTVSPTGCPMVAAPTCSCATPRRSARKRPDSWGVMFESGTPADGAMSVYDNPIYIADAALYLMATQPDLGITNPYALDETQFAAAIDLLEQQAGLVGQYWAALHRSADRPRRRDRARRDDVAGHRQPGARQRSHDRRRQAGRGSDRLVGHVDGLRRRRRTPTACCCWMDWITSPWANAQVAEWFGEAPSNSESCALTANPDHCSLFHAEETEYWEDVWYWTTRHRGVPRRSHRRHLRPVCRVGQRLERTPVLVDSVPPRNLGKL